ncbi:AaceriACR015Wp [[Ashbya] aceris (nom. inval.)]|nr:AaceriACR015Wp [[Ashbya] aceris (nom. inval.)]
MRTVQEMVTLYDRHRGCGHVYAYGTAGFRSRAEVLAPVVFATGLLACLRSLYLGGAYVGVMLTASHNPPEDNGVKLVDPHGEMLAAEWEKHATALANSASQGQQELLDALHVLVDRLGLDLASRARVVVARDSRASGPQLLDALLDGTRMLEDVEVVDCGMLTTPQLHFLTCECNERGSAAGVREDLYYAHFVAALEELAALHGIETLPYPLVVDTANGVGALKARELFRRSPLFKNRVLIINDNWSQYELLNSGCGADYVKTKQCLPQGISADIPRESLFCSYDGDADRVIFYYIDEKERFHLLDGDKISTLIATFLQSTLITAGINDDVCLGVVQTAYANGSSTKYLSEVLEVPVSCTPTGVKHLHREAVQKYDVGIYFEANGHGTVIFSEHFTSTVERALGDPALSAKARLSLQTLKTFANLINQTIGDAISDMLAVIAILSILHWSPEDWDKQYTDLPNNLVKVVVPDRSMFKTTNAERQLTSPSGLQEMIDGIVMLYDSGRSFVRASGTEDAVRIYAEAGSQQQADELATKVSTLVVESTNGPGICN